MEPEVSLQASLESLDRARLVEPLPRFSDRAWPWPAPGSGCQQSSLPAGVVSTRPGTNRRQFLQTSALAGVGYFVAGKVVADDATLSNNSLGRML